MIVRRVFSSALQLAIASAVIRLLSLLSFPVLTRLLSPAAYGVASLATTVISICTIFGVAGQDASLVKAYFDRDNYSQDAIDRFYYKYAWVGACCSGLIAAIIWWVMGDWNGQHTSILVSALVGLGTAGSVLSTFRQARTRLLDAYGRLVWGIVISGVVSTVICMVAAWLWRRDEVALLLAGSSYWVMVWTLPSLGTRRGWAPSGLSKSQIPTLIRIGLPLIATAPGYWVVSSADRWFLNHYATKDELGIYSVAVTVASLGQMVTSALTNVWYPELARQLHKKDTSNLDELVSAHSLVIWLLGLTCFGICLFGSDLIRILANVRFFGAAQYVPWLSLGLFFYGVNQFQGFGFTMHRKNHIVPLIWLVVAIVSLTANYLFVPLWHGMGAAAAQCLTFLVAALLTWAVSKRYTQFQPRWLRLFVCVMFFVCVVAVSPYALKGVGMLVGILIKMALFAGCSVITLLWVTRWSWADLLRHARALLSKWSPA